MFISSDLSSNPWALPEVTRGPSYSVCRMTLNRERQWIENAGMVIADLSWVTKKSIAEEVRLG